MESKNNFAYNKPISSPGLNTKRNVNITHIDTSKFIRGANKNITKVSRFASLVKEHNQVKYAKSLHQSNEQSNKQVKQVPKKLVVKNNLVTNNFDVNDPRTQYEYNNVIQYHPEAFNKLRYANKQKLPIEVRKILCSSEFIQKDMNENDKNEYKEQIKTYDREKIKKEIKSLFNKLSLTMYKKMCDKLSIIIKDADYDEEIISFILTKIITICVNRPFGSNTLDKNRFAQFKCYSDACMYLSEILYDNKDVKKDNLVKKILANLIDNPEKIIDKGEVLRIDLNDELVEDHAFEKKCRYVLLNVIITNLYNSKFMGKRYINKHIKNIILGILAGTKEDNDIFIDILCVLHERIKEELKIFSLNNINGILDKANLNMRCKFRLQDLRDTLI